MTKLMIGTFEHEEWFATEWEAATPKEELSAINRRCLKCDREFRAIGRHYRICYMCRSSETYCSASKILDYSS